MELFIINTYLSLLIFNPLEAAVLFLAATGDFRQVFSKRFIKHWFILGSINFVFQYLASCLDVGFARLFINHFNSIIIMSCILYIYLNFINKKYNIKYAFLANIFNTTTILVIIMFFKKIVFKDFDVGTEIVINLTIKIFQFLLLYLYNGGFIYEKFCKKYFKKSK